MRVHRNTLPILHIFSTSIYHNHSKQKRKEEEERKRWEGRRGEISPIVRERIVEMSSVPHHRTPRTPCTCARKNRPSEREEHEETGESGEETNCVATPTLPHDSTRGLMTKKRPIFDNSLSLSLNQSHEGREAIDHGTTQSNE